MKLFITKYALSGGIQEVDGELNADGTMAAWKNEQNWWVYAHGEGKNWHRTREAAVERANAQRETKIASLKKQIAKLEKRRFE